METKREYQPQKERTAQYRVLYTASNHREELEAENASVEANTYSAKPIRQRYKLFGS